MNDTYELLKDNPLLPAEDYEALRSQGFKEIEKLGNRTWTEYNNSDPGITILEALCYAITDLAYRTGFEVKDLLTPENLTEDTWKNIFYTARRIFHNSPLTLTDYRKLIIDVKGVRNAWIEPSKDYEVPVWIDYNYFERIEDTDCQCKDKEKHTCFGQLSLEPVNKTQIDERNKAKKEAIEASIVELKKQLQESENQIETLKVELVAAGNDEVAKQAIQRRIDKAYQTKEKFISKIDEYVREKKIIDAQKFIPSKIVEIEGLYNIIVEYEEDVLDEGTREETRHKVVARLAAHRNLCEDFLTINAVEYEDFGLGISAVLEEYADPDEVLAEIFFVIYRYFSPSVPFHTIPEMMEMGYQSDEIFEGPALQHGFIVTEELEKTDLYRDIRLSDIINEVSDIKGIKAITFLHLPFMGFHSSYTDKFYFDEWVKFLEEDRKIARIQPSLSSAMFCKEHDFITYYTEREEDRRPERMLKMFNDKKKRERKYKLTGHDNDFPVPSGEYMDLQDYYPVTYSLPMCYGVGLRGGLPLNADEKRITQTKQLKGYLLFFEQLLSDYLVQLDHLRDLFSFDHKEQTYFTKALAKLDGIQSLIIDKANRGKDHFDEILEDFSSVLKDIIEPPAVFRTRRNVLLNHMLARFGENLGEYERIDNWLSGDRSINRIILDKENILKDGAYYKISTNRGKAYNYTQQRVWDTPNVSGAETRIGRLLGFRNVNRRYLAPDFITNEPLMVTDEKTKTQVQKKNKKGKPLNVIILYKPGEEKKILLTSVEVVEGCCTEELMGEILYHADSRKNFRFHQELKQRSRKSAGIVGVFWFELWDDPDPEKGILLATSEKFEKMDERETTFKELRKALNYINENEGMHLLEHILLRPRIDAVLDEAGVPMTLEFLKICLDECDLGKGLDEGEIPPYQKKIHRIPPERCYDNLPWVLEYFRYNNKTGKYDVPILFQETFPASKEPIPLKFRHYNLLAGRVKDLEEYGSERINYRIVSNEEEQPEKIKYSFKILGENGKVLAQSPYAFNRKTKIQEEKGIPIPEDIELEIEIFMRYFEYLFDLYCEQNPCDNNEDPFSFRTTLVLPCWPKRLRDKTFRNLVQKTIDAETPAHVHTRVVWLGIWQMKKFEEVYRAWLQEMALTEMPGYEFVNPLIDTVNKLEPCGTCTDECGHS